MINIGIIGAGRIAWQHIEGFLACRDVRIAALADRLPENAHALAAKYRLKSGDRPVKIFADYRCLLPVVNAISIVTPDYTHATIVKDALAARKHVLCEKPFGINGLAAEAMALLAREVGVIHMVRYHYRFSTQANWLRRAIASGDFGQIRHVRGRLTANRLGDPNAPFEWRHSREQGGYGALTDLGSHLVDLALFLLGEKISVTEVCGSGQIFVRERRETETGLMREVTAWDAASFEVKFTNGALGTFEVSRFAPGMSVLELDGSKRSVRFDLTRGTLAVHTFQPHQSQKPESEFKSLRPAGMKAPTAFETFVRAIREKRPAKPSFHDGAHCLRILDAVDQAMREGRTIKPF